MLSAVLITLQLHFLRLEALEMNNAGPPSEVARSVAIISNIREQCVDMSQSSFLF